MLKELRASHFIAVSIALLCSVSAEASASRTFVATTGNDANTATNCGATTPCRSFFAALSVTNAGGELVVLNSGGYGPASIAQPVVMTAIGVDASISVITTGATGLTINTAGNVTLNGLNLHGEAAGVNGIDVTQVGYLRLYNMLIENFTSYGVNMIFSGSLAVYGSEMNDNAAGGINLGGLANPVVAYVSGSSFDNNAIGVGVGLNSSATVADSSALNSSTAGFLAVKGQLTLINSRSEFNGSGMVSEDSGVLYFGNCLITNNSFAYQIASGGTMAGTNPGTSFIDPAQSTMGTLSPAIALQ